MSDTTKIEQERQAAQHLLDSLKSLQERNRAGQFATPLPLAQEITQQLKALRGADKTPIHFIEPSLGTGAFYSALRTVFSEAEIAEALGIEFDPSVASVASQLWSNEGLNVVRGDFTTQTPIPRYNFLLANPPYVRHHHLTVLQKNTLQSAVHSSTGYAVHGLAGLYCYFLLLAHRWLSEGALAAWLIPSEFMDVNYGDVLRRYLTERVTLLQIHRAQPTDLQFSDALVSSAIVLYRVAPPSPDHLVRFSLGGRLDSPDQHQEIPVSALRRQRKWTQIATSSSGTTKATSVVLGDLFEIKRGIATGANEFFILSREEAIRRQLPERFLHPILPSPRYLSDQIIEAEFDGFPRIADQLVLIDCRLPLEQVQAHYPALATYLASGQHEGLDQRYLATKRTPWYRQEQRPVARFLCTYMGRNPFRFFWNQSQALAPNVYLLLYPRGVLQQTLQTTPGLYADIFAWLKNIEGVCLQDEGRVYGGALHKIEPRELGRVPVENTDWLTYPAKQMRLF